jgi:hypothetical protein
MTDPFRMTTTPREHVFLSIDPTASAAVSFDDPG